MSCLNLLLCCFLPSLVDFCVAVVLFFLAFSFSLAGLLSRSLLMTENNNTKRRRSLLLVIISFILHYFRVCNMVCDSCQERLSKLAVPDVVKKKDGNNGNNTVAGGGVKAGMRDDAR